MTWDLEKGEFVKEGSVKRDKWRFFYEHRKS